VRVRRALAYAIDRDKQNTLTSGGIGTPASGPFAKGVMGYLPDTGYPEYDPAEARALLDDYETETGIEVKFTITSPADENSLESAQVVKSAWDAVGIDTTIQPVGDQSQYISYAVGGQYDVILWRNHPGGDPDGQYVWWHSGSPVNFGRINDPVIDRDLEAGRVERDRAKREQTYEDLNREFAAQVWNVWGNWSIWAVPYVKGLHAEGGAFGPPLPGKTTAFRGLATGHPVYQFWREA
jgi:peptide/nickel transport system substrate-binding protein